MSVLYRCFKSPPLSLYFFTPSSNLTQRLSVCLSVFFSVSVSVSLSMYHYFRSSFFFFRKSNHSFCLISSSLLDNPVHTHTHTHIHTRICPPARTHMCPEFPYLCFYPAPFNLFHYPYDDLAVTNHSCTDLGPQLVTVRKRSAPTCLPMHYHYHLLSQHRPDNNSVISGAQTNHLNPLTLIISVLLKPALFCLRSHVGRYTQLLTSNRNISSKQMKKKTTIIVSENRIVNSILIILWMIILFNILKYFLNLFILFRSQHFQVSTCSSVFSSTNT